MAESRCVVRPRTGQIGIWRAGNIGNEWLRWLELDERDRWHRQVEGHLERPVRHFDDALRVEILKAVPAASSAH